MTDAQEPEVITAAYSGRRLSGSKVRYVFTLPDRSTLSFSGNGFSGAVIGKGYDLTKIGQSYRLPDFWHAARNEAHDADWDTATAWQAQDRACDLEMKARRQKHPELEETINRLRLARCTMSHQAQLAFDAWLLDQIRRLPK